MVLVCSGRRRVYSLYVFDRLQFCRFHRVSLFSYRLERQSFRSKSHSLGLPPLYQPIFVFRLVTDVYFLFV